MISAIVEPNHAFAMVSTNDWHSLQAGGKALEGVWSFTLEPAHFVMEQRMLRTIRNLAEKS